MRKIEIEINNDLVKKYLDYYFETYPRRKKEPITSPIPPSMNQWIYANKFLTGNMKKAWKEFGIWIVKNFELENEGIKKCHLEIEFFGGTKRLFDLDNLSPKFLLDSFVAGGLLVEDNYMVITSIKMIGSYRKKNPGTKFTFYIHGDDDNGKEKK